MLGIPVWVIYTLGGLGGAAALGAATKKHRKPYLESAKSGPEPIFPPATGGDVVSRALVFTQHVKAVDKLVGQAKTKAEFEALAADAKAQRDAEVAAAHKGVDQLSNEWTKTGTEVLLKSGVGIVAIPFFVAGMQLVRAAGHLQVWVINALGLGGNGWTEEWQNDAEAHLQWFVDAGLPFPEFDSHQVSPKGYVQGVLYPQHLEVDIGVPADQRDAIFRMGKSFKAHAKDNPAVLGMLTVVGDNMFGMDGISQFDADAIIAGTEGAAYSKTGSDYDKIDTRYEDKYTPHNYFDLVISAIGTTTAQDKGVPFESWQKVVDAARLGMGLGLRDGWSPDPAGNPHVSPGVWAWSRARLEAEKAADKLPRKGLKVDLGGIFPIGGLSHISLPKWGP